MRPAHGVAACIAELAVGGESPPVQAPVVGSTTETKASGFSHCRFLQRSRRRKLFCGKAARRERGAQTAVRWLEKRRCHWPCRAG